MKKPKMSIEGGRQPRICRRCFSPFASRFDNLPNVDEKIVLSGCIFSYCF
jgi:hypothetical protein